MVHFSICRKTEMNTNDQKTLLESGFHELRGTHGNAQKLRWDLLLSVGSVVRILSGTSSGSLKYGFPFFIQRIILVAVVFHTARLILKHLLCHAVQFPFITEGIATFVSLHRMSKYISAFVAIWITEDKNLDERKKLYYEEGSCYYHGNLFIPDDLESLEL